MITMAKILSCGVEEYGEIGYWSVYIKLMTIPMMKEESIMIYYNADVKFLLLPLKVMIYP